MNAKTTTRTTTSSIFLTNEPEDDSAESPLSSTSSQGAQETIGQGSEIGTSKYLHSIHHRFAFLLAGFDFPL